MRELFEAFNSRLKTPILGNYFLAFLLLNWKAVLLLLFDSPDIDEKIVAFEDSISASSALTFPLLLALSFSLAQPLLTLIGAYIAFWPVHWRRMLQLKSDSSFEDQKQSLDLKRRQLLGEIESEAISSAKRDEEIGKIEDDDTRLELQRQIDDIRSNMGTLSPENLESLNEKQFPVSMAREWVDKDGRRFNLSMHAITLLMGATRDGAKGEILRLQSLSGTTVQSGKRSWHLKKNTTLVDFDAAISQLEELSLIRDLGVKGEIFRVTKLGYELSERLNVMHPDGLDLDDDEENANQQS